jgi:hypothetical protein
LPLVGDEVCATPSVKPDAVSSALFVWTGAATYRLDS